MTSLTGYQAIDDQIIPEGEHVFRAGSMPDDIFQGLGTYDASDPTKFELLEQHQRADGTYYFSGDRDIDSALIGSKWAMSEITYSFPTDGSQYPDPYDTGQPDFQVELNAAQKAAAQYAFSLISSYTELTFRQINEGENGEHATLRLSQTLDPDVGSAMGYFPGPNYDSGDIWFGRTSQPYYDTPTKGSWGFSTFLHEIGHTMGLKHGHQDYTKSDLGVYFGLDESTPRYGSQATPTNHDGQAWTLMSYRSDPNQLGATVFQGDAHNQPQTYMQNDIAALQYMYGANYTTNATDTIYSWSETTGQMFLNGVGEAVAPNSNTIFMTLWDGGGNDTFDLQNYDNGVAVDLRPGGFTTLSADQLANNRAYTDGFNLAPGNVATALLYQGNTASLIENAIGGDGNDVLIGNQVANSLVGGMGNDVLQGEQGNDTLDGGAGSDTAVFVNNMDGVTVTLNNGAADVVVTSASGVDTLRGIENVVGGHGDDVLTGDDANNMLDGGVLGHDTLKGGAGDDQLIGSGFIRTASDLPDLEKPASQANLDRPSAMEVVPAQFDTAPDVDINESTTLPHVTINATSAGGGLEYYKFTVNAGDRAIFDIDTFASSDLDSWIELLDSAGTKIANNDTGNSGDSGGYGNDDALLTYTFATAGTYYLRVGQWNETAGSNALPLDPGMTYTLNISLSSGNVSTFSTTDTGTGDLDGGAGNDFIVATVGDDLITGGTETDTLSYRQAYAGVNVSLAAQGAAQDTGTAGMDTISGIENLTGSSFADSLTGDNGANVIDGGLGNDSLNGGDGIDTVTFAAAASAVTASLLAGTATGGGGSDSLVNFENVTGSAFNDTLTGSAGLNSINGGDGDDFLNGGGATGGVDTIVGGAGFDVASFAGYTNDITADLTGGDDDISGDTVAVFSGVEGLEGGSGSDNLLGSNVANTLIGNDGNDVLLGRGGNDTLRGGLGDDRITGGGAIDTADYSGATGVTLNLTVTAAQNTGLGNDTVTGIENVITGSGADNITGTGGANTFIEGGGNDTYNGGGGVDTLDYSSRTALVNVNLQTTTGQNTGGGGTDTITNFENVTGTAFGDSLAGQNAITANVFLGGGGTDLIQGNTGADYIEGGDGADLIAGDILNNISSPDGVVAGDGNDTIYGGQGADVIIAGLGDDWVDAGTGNDTIVQGLGNGTRNVSAGTATLSGIYANDGGNDTINGGEGVDTVYLFYGGRAGGVSVDISNPLQTNTITVGGVASGALIDVERMIVRGGIDGDRFVGGITADALYGNEGDDTINGGIGNDSLIGGAGNDKIIGGEGIDNFSFVFATATTSITSNIDLAITDAQDTGEGLDTFSGVENLVGQLGNDTFSGDAMFNVFTDASGGNDTFVGRGGNDTLTFTRTAAGLVASTLSMSGDEGNDFLTVNSATRTVSSVAQYDTITVNGGLGNDTISVTGTGVNTAAIDAGAGADLITIGLTAAAGRGAYNLTLGTGSDTVTFSGTGTVATTTARTSIIQDFQAKDGGDRFELSVFTNGSGFTGHIADSNAFADGHLRLVQSGTSLLLQADRDGVGATNSFVTIMEIKDGVSKGFTAFNFDGMQVNNLLLTGGVDADILAGSDGADTLLGGANRDYLDGGKGDDLIDGGEGGDTVNYGYATSGVTVDLSVSAPQTTGWGADTLVSIEHVDGSDFGDNLSGNAEYNLLNGGGGFDILSGAAGDDRLFGGDGQDQLNGGADNDRLDGGGGIDTVTFAGVAAALTISLKDGVATGDGNDVLVKIENVIGGDGADVITGSNSDNQLEGGGSNDMLIGLNGADSLLGGSGADTLDGGRGVDALTGGLGADRFVFGALDVETDRILDLDNNDVIDVSLIDSNGNKAGNPDFVLVSEFHNVRGELMVSYDSGADVTRILMDTNGDGVADRTILANGNHADFTNFAF
jgi:Ca2+-binding RTX toxin-like protein